MLQPWLAVDAPDGPIRALDHSMHRVHVDHMVELHQQWYCLFRQCLFNHVRQSRTICFFYPAAGAKSEGYFFSVQGSAVPPSQPEGCDDLLPKPPPPEPEAPAEEEPPLLPEASGEALGGIAATELPESMSLSGEASPAGGEDANEDDLPDVDSHQDADPSEQLDNDTWPEDLSSER